MVTVLDIKPFSVQAIILSTHYFYVEYMLWNLSFMLTLTTFAQMQLHLLISIELKVQNQQSNKFEVICTKKRYNFYVNNNFRHVSSIHESRSGIYIKIYEEKIPTLIQCKVPQCKNQVMIFGLRNKLEFMYTYLRNL